MKKMLLPFGLLTAAFFVSPSTGSAKLVLDMPPILAGKPPVPCVDDAGCTSGKKCCSGSCYSDSTQFCYEEKVYAKSNGFDCGGTYYPTGVGYCCGGTHYATTDGFCCENVNRTTGFCCNGIYYADSCPAGPTGRLNDTGILANVGSSGQEDADFGRDKTVPDPTPTDGAAGFSFTKLNDTCVLDNVTGLAWEVETAATTYANWDAAKNHAATFTGCNNGSVTYTCRLPTVKELVGIVHFGKTSAPFIDATFFPNTGAIPSLDIGTTYLSGTEVANASSSASTQIWGVDFSWGNTDNAIAKTSGGYRVRAVCVPQ